MEGALSTQQATCQDGALITTGNSPSCHTGMLLCCVIALPKYKEIHE